MRRREFLAALAVAGSPALAYAAEGGDKKKKSGGVSYLPIDTLTGATNKPGGRRGVLSVECGLDVPDDALRDRAQASLPRLRAAYVQTVMIYAAGLPPATPPSPDYLSAALQRETDRVLGRSGARLLLGAVLVN
jgi:hypothetical protein